MISDLDGSLGARYFLKVTNERRCFASLACAFKSSNLITCLKHFWLKRYLFLSRLNEIDGGCEKILPVSGSF